MSISQEYREELAHVLLECLIDYNDKPGVIGLSSSKLDLSQAINLIRNYGDSYSDISISEIWEANEQLKRECAQYA